MPLALREARVWGAKERVFERALALLSDAALAQLLEAAHICDGLVKGLKHPDWPLDPWDSLKRLVLMIVEWTAAASSGGPRSRMVQPRLALG
jgi:DNA polymerase-3 subunit delta